MRMVLLVVLPLLLSKGAGFADVVGEVPVALRKELKLSTFYAKHLSVEGFPIVASTNVRDADSFRYIKPFERPPGNAGASRELWPGRCAPISLA
jgi:hypothetical protein